MNTFVIDASIAVKWVVEEDGTAEALALRQSSKMIAPQLLVAECANILWKKVRRGDLTEEQARGIAHLVAVAPLEVGAMFFVERCKLSSHWIRTNTVYRWASIGSYVHETCAVYNYRRGSYDPGGSGSYPRCAAPCGSCSRADEGEGDSRWCAVRSLSCI